MQDEEFLLFLMIFKTFFLVEISKSLQNRYSKSSEPVCQIEHSHVLPFLFPLSFFFSFWLGYLKKKSDCFTCKTVVSQNKNDILDQISSVHLLSHVQLSATP